MPPLDLSSFSCTETNRALRTGSGWRRARRPARRTAGQHHGHDLVALITGAPGASQMSLRSNELRRWIRRSVVRVHPVAPRRFENHRSWRRCRPDTTGSRLRASKLRQEFVVLLQESLDQVGKVSPGKGAAAEWNAGDIAAADSGEMGNDLTGFVSAEDKPWVPFVGDATVSLNGQRARAQPFGCALQMPEFVGRPALPVGPHLGKESCPASHW